MTAIPASTVGGIEQNICKDDVGSSPELFAYIQFPSKMTGSLLKICELILKGKNYPCKNRSEFLPATTLQNETIDVG